MTVDGFELQFGGNYLGKQYDPFDTGGDPNGATFKVQNLTQVAGLDLPRLLDRLSSARDYLLSHAGVIPKWILSRRD